MAEYIWVLYTIGENLVENNHILLIIIFLRHNYLEKYIYIRYIYFEKSNGNNQNTN